ncbi:MAG: bifunctional phosphoribosyl-AMP cyclohydrolase/phosphoribosyl-ATP diphosphatase HisIE [Chloroflexi bacterium]|nr:bifunctional phosphoribosyl-AMP cyclohydrolase/phosphoribosyl-ATP diphosphatase HisIE [Chloroflexota bacterium]
MVKFSDDGLIPAIAQDANTGEVLMVAYMSEEALRRTIDSGQAWFYSRSRRELWHKGATSGCYLNVRAIEVDCDEDALLLRVEPEGPTCHTGHRSCFYRKLGEQGTEAKDTQAADTGMVGELFRIIKERQRTRPEGSYASRLFEGGIDRIGRKVVEEAGEAVIAAKNGDLGPIAGEVADLWFHSLMLLAACGLSPEDVWAELRKRRK